MTIHTRTSAELTAAELYALLTLRVNVFVVEQTCPYPELDGRDLLADTVHIWVEEDDRVLAGIRVLRSSSAHPVIGRVVTAATARGRGVAGSLIEYGIALCGPQATIELHAQEHLEYWYGRFGFIRNGATYDEDGIAHVPMVRVPVV